MSTLFYSFLLTSTIIVQAQVHRIQWTSGPNEKPAAQNCVSYQLPVYIVEHAGNIQTAKIIPQDTRMVSYSDSALSSRLKNEYTVEIEHAFRNNRYISFIRIVPLRNTHSGVERLEAFTLELTPGNPVVQEPRTLIRPNRTQATNARTTAANTSVLSSGNWYKLSVSSDGIYKLDYNFFTSNKLHPESIDPRTIKIFGNGSGMLPQKNSAARIDDLAENAILFEGESDGVFHENDYLLFYAKGPDPWKYKTGDPGFYHEKNLYSENAYYFITFGGIPGLRLSNLPDELSSSTPITEFNERQFHESDEVNILSSGREWFGETFDGNTSTRSFNFSIPGLKANSDIRITSKVVGRNNVTSVQQYFAVALNNVSLANQNLLYGGSNEYDPVGAFTLQTYTVASASIGNTENLSLSYRLVRTNASVTAHLDYIEVNAIRNLRLYNNSTAFRCLADAANTLSTFEIDNADASCRIWNITTPYRAAAQSFQVSGNKAVFSYNSDTIEEYIIFKGNDFPAPQFAGAVANQNLHGITAPDLPDMVIVVPAAFRTAADDLAHFRKQHDNLDVWVATTEEVYNEFSSGAQDITAIRDFVKMLYDRKSGNDSIRYLLLMGDASYVYKGENNIVPGYQSRESFLPLKTFPSDDYFGLLDNNEGHWGETERDLMDIGVGRLPVKTPEEANDVVRKIMHYSSSSDMGKWKNRIVFVADDGDSNFHQTDAEDLAVKVDNSYKRYLPYKVYLDACIQEASPGGERSPDAKNKLDLEIEKGALLVNYTGHGGEGGWTQEGMLDWNQIEAWNNYYRLPFFITATCEFGRYDNPNRLSGAEVALLRADGGAIGLITSARVVLQYRNKDINTSVFNFILPSENAAPLRMGDIMRLSKNQDVVTTSNVYDLVYNRNYTLLGDPSLQLLYPKENVVITKIKNNPVGATPDTLRALEEIKLEGEVRDDNNVLLNAYKGELNITVFDKTSMLTTYGTQSLPFQYKSGTNYIFEGKASIQNGLWNVTFIVPKDITYNIDFGKISFYAAPSSGSRDANGIFTNVVVGGTDTTAIADDVPPVVSLFMNDESFVFGGLVGNDEATFIARLSDANGINVAGSGIGHELTGELDNSQEIIVMNDFYSANVNDYKNGYVRYPLKNLAPGTHTIKFKAWDTHNNSSESNLEFVVANNEKSTLDHVLNYPNPFSTYTEFHFDHNKPADDLDVMVQVFTISGKLIKTLQTKIYSAPSHISGLAWDGRDDYGDRIGKGVYVYKVSVRCPRDGSAAHKFEKLVVLY